MSFKSIIFVLILLGTILSHGDRFIPSGPMITCQTVLGEAVEVEGRECSAPYLSKSQYRIYKSERLKYTCSMNAADHEKWEILHGGSSVMVKVPCTIMRKGQSFADVIVLKICEITGRKADELTAFDKFHEFDFSALAKCIQGDKPMNYRELYGVQEDGKAPDGGAEQ